MSSSSRPGWPQQDHGYDGGHVQALADQVAACKDFDAAGAEPGDPGIAVWCRQSTMDAHGADAGGHKRDGHILRMAHRDAERDRWGMIGACSILRDRIASDRGGADDRLDIGSGVVPSANLRTSQIELMCGREASARREIAAGNQFGDRRADHERVERAAGCDAEPAAVEPERSSRDARAASRSVARRSGSGPGLQRHDALRPGRLGRMPGAHQGAAPRSARCRLAPRDRCGVPKAR